MKRIIAHIDMDAFYSSIEQRDNPSLKGKPVIVGKGKRGVVSAASYEARAFGVRSAMPIFQAKKLCPNGIFLPVRIKRYQKVSKQVMEILKGFTPLLEQISIDEAFLDITGMERLFGPPKELGVKIKKEIFEKLSLTASVGIAPNKFLSKIASDINKPDALTIIEEKDIKEFLEHLPVSKLPGVGEKTLLYLEKLGTLFVSDIAKVPERVLTKGLGKWGKRLIQLSLGIDDSPVVPNSLPKSVSAEDTFKEDTKDKKLINKMLLLQSEKIGERLRKQKIKGKTITLKIKFGDFSQISRNITLSYYTNATKVIYDNALNLFENVKIDIPVRLVGVGVSKFDIHEHKQYTLFEDDKFELADIAVDKIRERFGEKYLKRGTILLDE
ncbi:MAG: DNA polymerase IV [Deltaproteobacteria bacterium]|nr:DNA polymerase IV [Deltaproteobacteria bacterium]